MRDLPAAPRRAAADPDRTRRRRQDPPRPPVGGGAERRFADGVCFVPLAAGPRPGPGRPRRSPRRSASATTRRSARRRSSRAIVPARQRELLLLLDNFEQVLAAAPADRRAAGAPARALTVLVTSRTRAAPQRRARVPRAAAGAAAMPRTRVPDLAAIWRRRRGGRASSSSGREAVSPDFALTAANAADGRRDLRPAGRAAAGDRAGRGPRASSDPAAPCWPGWTNRLPLLTGGARDLPARLRTHARRHRLELRPARPPPSRPSSAASPSSPAASPWKRPRP